MVGIIDIKKRREKVENNSLNVLLALKRLEEAIKLLKLTKTGCNTIIFLATIQNQLQVDAGE